MWCPGPIWWLPNPYAPEASRRGQPHHQLPVRLAEVARQRQRQVGVETVVDVGQLQIGVEDGGFDGDGIQKI